VAAIGGWGARGFAEVLKRMFAVGLLVPTRKQHEEGGVARGLTGWPARRGARREKERDLGRRLRVRPLLCSACSARTPGGPGGAAIPCTCTWSSFPQGQGGVINFRSLPLFIGRRRRGGVCTDAGETIGGHGVPRHP
jgi:hypothetical protein